MVARPCNCFPSCCLPPSRGTLERRFDVASQISPLFQSTETVYFVIELKELKLVVGAVRGTETPEDLFTDGLGRECILADTDYHGLLIYGTAFQTYTLAFFPVLT
ncbi:uncharacterized protein LOC9645783 [Selaginella moellendorffii]|uniref:uncharacterized protein LOC9645783 n=1 Tax=Selaginella moellendorffii TaxID=88036 RepID=UPI000D1CDD38|nr:uncharacterized protein LOC9645783 [Selaginella moellendorffii]|eukprot:XP_024522303.1 uncharacterized protein LOC9645783 [Selaginella moellendorffii]